MHILADTSFLYALTDVGDKYHQRARQFTLAHKLEYHIPDVVLTEVTYSLRKLMGKHAEIAFLQAQVKSKPALESLSDSDLARATQIMTRYTQFDFVDCCVMAIAERLKMTRICTFDRRDFGVFKPSHCDYLELLP
jgi:hypothetical protein